MGGRSGRRRLLHLCSRHVTENFLTQKKFFVAYEYTKFAYEMLHWFASSFFPAACLANKKLKKKRTDSCHVYEVLFSALCY